MASNSADSASLGKSKLENLQTRNSSTDSETEKEEEEEDAENDGDTQQQGDEIPVDRPLEYLNNVLNLYVGDVTPFPDNNGISFQHSEFYEAVNAIPDISDPIWKKVENEEINKYCSICHPDVTLQEKMEEVKKVMKLMRQKKEEKEEDKGGQKNGGEDCDNLESIKLTWEDVKIVQLKTPPDPSCMGDEVITKFIWKKKPRRRLKVPFMCKPQLPQRLSPEMEERMSELAVNSSGNVAMVLNVGRQRPLYQEQLDNVKQFENFEKINVNWAKFAVSAVKPHSSSTKVSRLLIPVLCEKLVKLIKYNEELKTYDKGVEYGIDKKLVDEKAKNEVKEKKVVRRSNPVVKSVVSKLMDAVVTNVESTEKRSMKLVSQRRVCRELKRLNASYIEIEEEQANQTLLKVDDNDNDNLAKVEKEYHQTVLKKKDEIIFMNKVKRARRRPLKLEDHVLEECDNDVENYIKCRRLQEDCGKDRRTDEHGKRQSDVADDSSNPPFLKECSVKLVKSPSLEKAREESSLGETYKEDVCSLPEFKKKVQEAASSPPKFKKRIQEDATSPPQIVKKRKTDNFGERKKASSGSQTCYRIVDDRKEVEGAKLKIRLKSTNSKDLSEVSLEDADDQEYLSPNSKSARSNTSRVPCEEKTKVAVKRSNGFTGTEKRVKTLSPVKRVCESEEMSVKIKSVMSLQPDDSLDAADTNKRTVVVTSKVVDNSNAIHFGKQVLFLKMQLADSLVSLTHKGRISVTIGREKLMYAKGVLENHPNNEMIHIPIPRGQRHVGDDRFFGVYYHIKFPSAAFVGPYHPHENKSHNLTVKHLMEAGIKQRVTGNWINKGEFVEAYLKSLNNQFEKLLFNNRLDNRLEQPVHLYRTRQPKVPDKTFYNISEEADKLVKKTSAQSLLNSIRNFRIKPLDELSCEENEDERNIGNSFELSINDNVVDTRVQSPDLDIVKMEVLSDSEDPLDKHVGNTRKITPNPAPEQPSRNKIISNWGKTTENKSVDKNKAKGNIEKVVRKTTEKNLAKGNVEKVVRKTIEKNQAKGNVEKEVRKPGLDKPNTSIIRQPRQDSFEENSTKAIAKMKPTPVSGGENESEVTEVFEHRIQSSSAHKVGNKTAAHVSKQPEGIETIDVSENVGRVPVIKPHVAVKKPEKVVQRTEKKCNPIISYRKIEPKRIYQNHANNKLVMRVNASKSILNPLKCVSQASIVPSNTTSLTGVKSLLKLPMTETPTQSSPITVSSRSSTDDNSSLVRKVIPPINEPKRLPASLQMNAIKILSPPTTGNPIVVRKLMTLPKCTPKTVQRVPQVVDFVSNQLPGANKNSIAVGKFVKLQINALNVLQISPATTVSNKISAPATVSNQISAATVSNQISAPATVSNQISAAATVSNQISAPATFSNQISAPATVSNQRSPPATVSHQSSSDSSCDEGELIIDEEDDIQAEPITDESNEATTAPPNLDTVMSLPEKSSLEDPDALKIVSNWKYNTKFMQSLGLYVDDEG